MPLFVVFVACFFLFVSGCFSANQAPAPVTHYGATEGAGSSGVHSVIPNDTLWSISTRYNISMRDIVFANNLRSPFVLDVGQRLTLPPPKEYRVRPGDSLYSVSRIFEVSTSEIAQKNQLSAPYIISPGQTLKLPSAYVSKESNIANVSKHNVETVQAPVPKQKVTKVSSTKVSSTEKEKPSASVKRVSQMPPKRSSGKFLKPVSGKILSKYGPQQNGLHNDGINIKAPRGTPVKAAENGVVVYAGNALKGSGNLVILRHDGGWMTAYAHMDKIAAKRGQVLKRGTRIGTVGSTGSVRVPQLHFEVRKGTHAVNPRKHLEG